jgi:hypothetical protein
MKVPAPQHSSKLSSNSHSNSEMAFTTSSRTDVFSEVSDRRSLSGQDDAGSADRRKRTRSNSKDLA